MVSVREDTEELDCLKREVRRLRERLNRLTPGVGVMLRRRGFPVYKKNPADDLLIPRERHLDGYYRSLHKYSFRLFLRDVIKHQKFFRADDVTRYATAGVTAGYISYLASIGLLRRKGEGHALRRHIKSFGGTLEWFVAEMLRREFGAEVLWGVKFKRPGIGGDYDVIAKLDGMILYAEVKSSPPRQIFDNEVAAFLSRVDALSPDIAVFFMDTELRMKDKIVPMFEKALSGRSAGPADISRIEKELFHIWDRVFIVNAKDSIVRNFETVLHWFFRREDAIG